jgi:haloalkane dehalogenase
VRECFLLLNQKVNKMMDKFFFALVIAFTFAGCANTADTKPLFDRYEAQFNQQQPHKKLTLIRADGFNISAREFGAEYKNTKPTIVMMHGFPDNQRLYDLLVPTLSSRYHVVTFDFLGWGDSDKPREHLYNVASQRADLDTVIAKMNLKSIVIVVHDLSGHAGIDWALDNEAKTTALVLLNTYYLPMPALKAPEAIEFYASSGVLRDVAVWGANKVAGRFQDGLSSQIEKFFSNAEIREIFVPVIAHSAPAIRPAFFSSTSVLWAEVDARAKSASRIQQFKKPTHVIFGADDPYLNKGVATEFHGLFSNGSLHLVENAGHYVQLDKAEEVGRLIMASLDVK